MRTVCGSLPNQASQKYLSASLSANPVAWHRASASGWRRYPMERETTRSIAFVLPICCNRSHSNTFIRKDLRKTTARGIFSSQVGECHGVSAGHRQPEPYSAQPSQDSHGGSWLGGGCNMLFLFVDKDVFVEWRHNSKAIRALLCVGLNSGSSSASENKLGISALASVNFVHHCRQSVDVDRLEVSCFLVLIEYQTVCGEITPERFQHLLCPLPPNWWSMPPPRFSIF